MLTRREWLRISAGAGAALALDARLVSARQTAPLIRRAIPSTGEELPAIGLGGANTFSDVARREDFDAIRGVLRTLVDGGASVFDTAAGYGASEEAAGQVAADLGIADRIFWATKVNVAQGRGSGGRADPSAARAQIERSFRRLRRPVIDLLQVHNMGDPPTQLGVARELKEAGRVRYVGITTTFEGQYRALVDVMRHEPLDFIGIDYAIDNRAAEEEILPLAAERKIGVLVYLPFGRSRMWARIGNRPLPDWASEFDAHSWAQLMLKFVLANPAVTVACPGTSDPDHMRDNLDGGRGRLPDAGHLARMVELVEGLPAA